MQGACIVTAFAPNTLFLLQALQKSQVGFLVSVSFGPRICPKSHTVSLYFVAQGEVSPGASAVAPQQRVPDPSLSGAGVLVTARQGSPLDPCSWGVGRAGAAVFSHGVWLQ